MSDVLEFAGVSVLRGGNTLLDDITWEVEEGQRWVILGPNGAGKTTLLQLAAGRIHPTTGVAGVLGEVLGVVDVLDLRPRIGLCSAAIAERLPADELVRDVVVTASYGIVGRWRESYDALDHARAADLLNALGAAHLAERTFGTLSEGERKRVQIARALMTDPELMLLDELAAGLDLGAREDLVARLGAMAADLQAPALVLVTHHVEENPPSFTDVLLIRAGRIVAAGPLEITLTAANLSETFGLALVLESHGQRWSARAAAAAEKVDPPSLAPPPRATAQSIPVSGTVLVH
jgi:iron complex transport system ATP-binding protein